MVTYLLDGGKMTTPALAHQHLQEVLHLSEDCPPDLDGLWEGLCEIPVPFHISILHWSKAVKGLEDYADELLEVFCDMVEEEPQFTFDVSD